jgi:hypothetical protein
MLALLALTGVYLFANFMLDKIKQDDYQKWLDKLPWGKHPNRQRWSETSDIDTNMEHDAQIAQNALFDLRAIIQKPTVSHQRLIRPSPSPQYTYAPSFELYGLVVTIQVPKEITQSELTLSTNLNKADEALTSGKWFFDTAIDSENLSTKTSERYSIYQIMLPANDSDRYLALSVGYSNNDNPMQKQLYYFQHSIKQSAIYSTITDNSKHSKIENLLSKETAEMSN